MLRFVCSPTSDMDIRDLRVALLNYIVSRQKNEEFVVRIEDMDKEKNIDAKDKEILDILDLFGIKYSQTLYQSENIRFHTAMALQLMHEKKAFSCFCSPEWLASKKAEAKADKKQYRYDDACANLPAELVIDNTSPFTIRIKRSTKDTESFVIMQQDKTPTYDFSCAVDDMLNDISAIVCEENYKENIQKQDHIRTALQYNKKIKYSYLPTILSNDTLSIKWLLEEGFLPEAISNYLISMGNSTPTKIFTLKEAIQWLDLKDLSLSSTYFDMDTLKKINKKHLKMLDAKELSRYVGFADEEIGELAKIYLENINTTKELKSKIALIFAPKIISEEFAQQSDIIIKIIKDAPYFDQYDDFKNYIMKESGLKDENFLKPLCLVLTGSSEDVDIEKIYRYIKNYIGEIVK